MAQPAAARHFERVAPTYTALRDGGLNGIVRRQEQRAVAELATVEAGARVLDAGCGDGEILAWLAARGARGVGVDLVEAMARHSRGRGFDVSVQDMERLALRPVFDWVLCIGSLEFTREPERAVAGFAGLLRPGGRLVLLFPRRGWLGRVYSAYHRAHGVPIWLFDRDEMTAMLRRHALEPEAWRDAAVATVCRARKVIAPASAGGNAAQTP
jgi:SAM-dependent methyltransferase